MKKTYKKIVKIMKKKAVAYDFPMLQFFKLNISEGYFVIFDAETGGLYIELFGVRKIYYLDASTPYCLLPELKQLLKDIENA